MTCGLCGDPLPHPPVSDTPCFCGQHEQGWPDGYPDGHGAFACNPHEHKPTRWRGEKIGWQCACGVVLGPLTWATAEEGEAQMDSLPARP